MQFLIYNFVINILDSPMRMGRANSIWIEASLHPVLMFLINHRTEAPHLNLKVNVT